MQSFDSISTVVLALLSPLVTWFYYLLILALDLLFVYFLDQTKLSSKATITGNHSLCW